MALANFVNSIITQDKFSATFNKFDKAVRGSGKELDKVGNIVSGGGFMALFGGAAGVYGATQIAKTVWSLGELGAQSLTTKASYDSLMRSVGQSPALLDQLTKAAGGTVTEMKLMQLTNTALAGSTGQLSTEMAGALPKLLEAGRAAALLNPSLGDAEFMFQSLITGIKRGSPMLIDNTGIVLKLGEATEAYAESVGKSVSELTAQERSIAILRGTLSGADTLIKQAGGSLDSMTTDIQRAKVAVEELKTALGELLAPTVAGVASGIALELQSVTAAIKSDEIKLTALEIRRLQTAYDDLATTTTVSASAERARVASMQAMAAEIVKLEAQLKTFTEREIGVQNASEGARWSLSGAAMGADKLDTAARAAVTGVGLLRDGLNELRFASQAMTGGGLTGEIDKLIGSNPYFSSYTGSFSQYAAAGASYDMASSAALRYASSMSALNDQFRKDGDVAKYLYGVEQLKLGLTDAVSGLRDTGGAVTDLESKLKGLISQKLAPTFDLSGLTGGLLGGQMGDTFDEAYKRLAAVALRPEELQIHAQDWAGTFEQAGLTGLTPEDAQARARELVEAYSKGLDFSLIDREAIKDSVRQAIKAEELYQTIVDEIYAEMGKENQKLNTAFYKMGKNGMGSATQAVKDQAPEVVNAWVGVLIDPLYAAMQARAGKGALP